ncbi:MAG: DUF58 domain-containing protein [Thermoplasmata archaeon]
MIRKSGYLILSASIYNLFESIMLGYNYYIIFSLVLFFIFASDFLIFNITDSKYIYSLEASLAAKTDSMRKYSDKDIFITISNRGKRKITFHYYTVTSDVFKIRGDYEGFLTIGPGETVVKNFSITAETIGKYEIGPLSFYSEDPMHLAIEKMDIINKIEIKVSPSVEESLSSRSERTSNVRFFAGIHYNKRAGQGYDFYLLRPYVPGDEIRYVAWSRLGYQNGDDIYVKQMEEERIIDMLFVVDFGYGMNQGNDGRRVYDGVISNIINMSYRIRRNQDGVGFLLMSSDMRIFIRPERNNTSIDKFQKVVSETRPSGVFSAAEALKEVGRKIRKNAVVFIVSAFSYNEDLSLLYDERRGQKIYAFVINPFEYIVNDPINEDLRRSLFIKQYHISRSISSVLNGEGIKSAVTGKHDMLQKFMLSYNYAKMTNQGE